MKIKYYIQVPVGITYTEHEDRIEIDEIRYPSQETIAGIVEIELDGIIKACERKGYK
jgi:hypothetical protein